MFIFNWRRHKWLVIGFVVFVAGFRRVPGIEGVAVDSMTHVPIPYPAIEHMWRTQKFISDGPGSNEHEPNTTLGDKNGRFKSSGHLVWAPWGVKSYSYWINNWKYRGQTLSSRSENKKYKEFMQSNRTLMLEPAGSYYAGICASADPNLNGMMTFDIRYLQLLKKRDIPIDKKQIQNEWASWCKLCPKMCDKASFNSAIKKLEDL